jgi:Predicted transcriptional regulator
MAVNYNKLWNLLKEKNLNKTYLRENGIHPSSIAKMGKNEYIDLKILSRICELLKCDFSNIMEYIPDDEPKE